MKALTPGIDEDTAKLVFAVLNSGADDNLTVSSNPSSARFLGGDNRRMSAQQKADGTAETDLVCNIFINLLDHYAPLHHSSPPRVSQLEDFVNREVSCFGINSLFGSSELAGAA